MKKIKTWKCKEYLEWVRGHACRATMAPGCDTHHIINLLPGYMGGKVSDLFTMPLCREEHGYLHDGGAKKWEIDTGLSQAEEVLIMINKALEDGVIEIKWIDK